MGSEMCIRDSYEVFALDVVSLGLSGDFDGEAARKAMKGHVLDSARVVGHYTLNPELPECQK